MSDLEKVLEQMAMNLLLAEFLRIIEEAEQAYLSDFDNDDEEPN